MFIIAHGTISNESDVWWETADVDDDICEKRNKHMKCKSFEMTCKDMVFVRWLACHKCLLHKKSIGKQNFTFLSNRHKQTIFSTVEKP